MSEKTWLQSSNMLTDGYGTVYYARTVKDAQRLWEILVSQTYGLNALTRERDEAVRERDAAVAWIDEHQIHDEDCPQDEEYKGEWDASDPHGQLQTWLGAHQDCTCGLWKLIGRTSLTTDKAAQETKDGEG